MDDVDAVQAQIARTMLESGDWVTARLDGIAYLEKSPLKYWMMAVSFAVFGVRDWAARLPLAFSVIALCWVTARFGAWAFSEAAGLYGGLSLATCIGLFLFTRIQIPDAILTLAITVAMWSFLRALEAEEGGRKWSLLLAASIGVGLLLKGLIAALFPVAAALIFLGLTGKLLDGETWRRLRPVEGTLVILAIAAPWHVLATLRNPPYFDFTMKSEPGKYHGFFWFYFFNEHLFRFLNMRHPRDYNTVPRVWFWLFHLLWLFPWSGFLAAALKGSGREVSDRAARTRLLALCWTGFLLVFFTFSTTQEYYSMPCYPALALLLGAAMTAGGRWIVAGQRIVGVVATGAVAAIGFILGNVWNLPAPGDISQALTQHPDAYTLSLGHMGDLTMASFAYLRGPLVFAGIGFLIGAYGAWRLEGRAAYFAMAAMMVVFLHAARWAMVVFDPYMGSKPLAEALMAAPGGELIADDQYYTFSSVFFYTNRRALLLNGRVNNLEYGSYAPGAPNVFLNDREFAGRWPTAERLYLLVEGPQVGRIEGLVGKAALHLVKGSGGKFLFTNQPLKNANHD